jgi:hypothetical protein
MQKSDRDSSICRLENGMYLRYLGISDCIIVADDRCENRIESWSDEHDLSQPCMRSPMAQGRPTFMFKPVVGILQPNMWVETGDFHLPGGLLSLSSSLPLPHFTPNPNRLPTSKT